MGASDKAIPGSLLRKAQCAIIIPGMKKGGFIFSGKYGRGYAACRRKGGGWTNPAGMRIEGGGFGLQIGGSETDLIMLVMSKKGMNGLLASKFTLDGIEPVKVPKEPIQLIAELPDGSIEPLLWLQDYRPEFAHSFLLRKPLGLPARTIIRGVPEGASVRLLPR